MRLNRGSLGLMLVTIASFGLVLLALSIFRPNLVGLSPSTDGLSSAAPNGGSSAQPTGPSPSSTEASGKFQVVPGVGRPVGSGRRLSYAVSVESSLGEDAGAVADAVEKTLANQKQGWTSQREYSFQRVERNADVTIQLAAPSTVDKQCAVAGAQTDSYASCTAGDKIMLNVVRWRLGIPEYKKDLAGYRQYLVNHEIGHALGYVHRSCGGKGKLASVMLQQTYGLHGCRINPWPYHDGSFVDGPKMP